MNSPALFAVTLSFFLVSCAKGNAPNETGGQIVCTKEAMQCSDGSWVGRSGAKCEFVCPKSQPK